jgi:hypothetical protein
MAKKKKMKPLMGGIKGMGKKRGMPSRGSMPKRTAAVKTEDREPADRGRRPGMFVRPGMSRVRPGGVSRRSSALERRLEDKEL